METCTTACLVLRGPAAPLGEAQPLVLRRSTHGDLTGSLAGARWRIVSAKVRPDGRLRADLSTCVFALEDLPDLSCRSSERGCDASGRGTLANDHCETSAPTKAPSPFTRSQMIARIRSKDTRPEVKTRVAVHALRDCASATTWQISQGKPESRQQAAPMGDLRPRLLLALSPWLRARFVAKIEHRLLDGQARAQSGA